MTAEELWQRYAVIWTLDADRRTTELKACLIDHASYCDTNCKLQGTTALSDYMGQFQRGVPGAQFKIRFVIAHHDRSLAHWALHAADGHLLQIGTSFGAFASDGRLESISGFFHPSPDGIAA